MTNYLFSKFRNMTRRNLKILIILFLVLAVTFHYNFVHHKQSYFEQVRKIIKDNKIINNNTDYHNEKQTNGQTAFNAENLLTAVNARFFNYTSPFLKNQPWAGARNYIDYTIIRLGLKPLVNVTPLRPEYGIVVNDVTAFKYPINIPKCRMNSVANRTLFMGIWSGPNDFYSNRRKLIRSTWLKHLNDPHYTRGLLDVIGYGFILGQTSNLTAQKEIEEESKNYGDILQVELEDTYRNLTKKTVSVINWVKSNCPHVDFAIKIDDDVYVNVHNFATVLVDLPPEEVSLYGHRCGGHSTDRYNKWALTYEQWPWNNYPQYVEGSAFLISGSAIFPFLAAAQVTPFLSTDDMFVGGVLSDLANVTIRQSNNYRFRTQIGGNWAPDPCFVQDHTTWMTNTPAQINASHSVMEELYRLNSSVKCLTPAPSKGLSEFYLKSFR